MTTLHSGQALQHVITAMVSQEKRYPPVAQEWTHFSDVDDDKISCTPKSQAIPALPHQHWAQFSESEVGHPVHLEDEGVAIGDSFRSPAVNPLRRPVRRRSSGVVNVDAVQVQELTSAAHAKQPPPAAMTTATPPSTLPPSAVASKPVDHYWSTVTESPAGSTSGEDIWEMTEEQRDYYLRQFLSLQPNPADLLPGMQAKIFFELSKLPVPELSRIWELSDVDCDGNLTLGEFCTAMHLVVLRVNGLPIPDSLPICLLPIAQMRLRMPTKLQTNNPFLQPDDLDNDQTETRLPGNAAIFTSQQRAPPPPPAPLPVSMPITSAAPAPLVRRDSSATSGGGGTVRDVIVNRQRHWSASSQSDVGSIAEGLTSFDSRLPSEAKISHPVAVRPRAVTMGAATAEAGGSGVGINSVRPLPSDPHQPMAAAGVRIGQFQQPVGGVTTNSGRVPPPRPSQQHQQLQLIAQGAQAAAASPLNYGGVCGSASSATGYSQAPAPDPGPPLPPPPPPPPRSRGLSFVGPPTHNTSVEQDSTDGYPPASHGFATEETLTHPNFPERLLSSEECLHTDKEERRQRYKLEIDSAKSGCEHLIRVNKELSLELKTLQEQRIALEIMLEHLMPLGSS